MPEWLKMYHQLIDQLLRKKMQNTYKKNVFLLISCDFLYLNFVNIC